MQFSYKAPTLPPSSQKNQTTLTTFPHPQKPGTVNPFSLIALGWPTFDF